MAVDASGGYLATGSADRLIKVRVWDLVTKTCMFNMTGGHMSAVPALALSPDGWQLLSGGRDKVVCVWDIRNGSRVATVPVFEALEGVAILPYGSSFPGVTSVPSPHQGVQGKPALFFATAGEKGLLRAAEAGGTPGLALTRQLIGNHDEVTDLAFLYNCNISSSAGLGEGQPAKVTGGAGAGAAEGGSSSGGGGGGGGVVLHPGEPQRLAVATNSPDIRLFQLSDASCIGSCLGHRDTVLCLDTVRPAPGVELMASGSKDCEVRLWDPLTSACLAVVAGHVAAVTAVAWAQSKAKAGKLLATGGADKLLKLWDTSKLLAAVSAATAEAAAEPLPQVPVSTIAAVAAHDKDVNAIAFSPNDALLATASQDRTIKLWRLPNLVLAQTLRGHKRGVWDVCFSPVDQVLLSCSADKLIKMWSVTEGSCLRTFEGHTAGVLKCRFLTAGTQVLSAGADGLLKLWDGRSGANTASFEAHQDRVWGLAASAGPAESLLVSGGADSRVVLWRDATAAKAAEAEAAEEELVLQQQELSNALADGDFATAARLAFQLRHPGRLLEVLRRQPGGPAAALEALRGLVGQLQPQELATALSYCRDWNTNTRNAPLAQVLLQAVLSSHKPEQILAVPGSKELLEGLLAYSQRHAARLDRLLRATFLLDYTLADAQHQLQQVQQLQFGKGGSRVRVATGKRQQPEADERYLDDGKQLPGWGGGDDLEDDWDLGSDDDADADEDEEEEGSEEQDEEQACEVR
eukprot:gene12078-12218_t